MPLSKRILAVAPVGQDYSCCIERYECSHSYLFKWTISSTYNVSGDTLQNLTCVASGRNTIVFNGLGNVYASLENGLIFLNVGILLTHDSVVQTQQTNHCNHSNLSCFHVPCFQKHPHMTERKMDERYHLSSACGRTFSQMGHWHISECWREKWFLHRVQLRELLSANGTATTASNEQGFFNPQLFDLIRPICICSRVMVRMKATVVIAFSRRHRFPHPLCSHCTVITPALSLCNHLHLPLMLL